MLQRLRYTIAAVASAPGPGTRGIIRISGPETLSIISASLQFDEPARLTGLSTATRLTATFLVNAAADLRLPVAVLVWPNRRSFTGEAMAEVHMLGSPPLMEAMLSRLFDHGATPAMSGEFTLRAFLNGRIDLVQAEAVLGVIDSSDQRLLEVALEQLAGGVSTQFRFVREQLLLDLADLEAGLDFVEEDIEFVDRQALVTRLQSSAKLIKRISACTDARLQSTPRRRVLLAGLPNAGKSSLFNQLVGRDQALVSTIAGTTRDYLTASVEWNRLLIELIDTAGWEANPIGPLAHGITARDEQWQHCQLVLWCAACNMNVDERASDQHLFESAVAIESEVERVWTKADLVESPSQTPEVAVSILDSDSIEALRTWIVDRLTGSDAAGGEILASTGARCRDSLRAAARSLDQALVLATGEADDALIALELRSALDELGAVTGEVYTDEILDRIFSRFCIGK